MALLCTVIGHLPTTVRHRNQGMEFAICHHCGCDLLREQGSAAWGELPEGYRVAWRAPDVDAAAVASRIVHGAPPRRRDPRTARPAARRDPRGRPLAGTASMIRILTNLGTLASEEEPEAATAEPGYVICLPGKAR